MLIATATAVVDEIGPLTQVVYDFVAAQRRAMAAGVTYAARLGSGGRIHRTG